MIKCLQSPWCIIIAQSVSAVSFTTLCSVSSKRFLFADIYVKFLDIKLLDFHHFIDISSVSFYMNRALLRHVNKLYIIINIIFTLYGV